jgi:hypothetical protein
MANANANANANAVAWRKSSVGPQLRFRAQGAKPPKDGTPNRGQPPTERRVKP